MLLLLALQSPRPNLKNIYLFVKYLYLTKKLLFESAITLSLSASHISLLQSYLPLCYCCFPCLLQYPAFYCPKYINLCCLVFGSGSLGWILPGFYEYLLQLLTVYIFSVANVNFCQSYNCRSGISLWKFNPMLFTSKAIVQFYAQCFC